jgi:cation/acetate symporter
MSIVWKKFTTYGAVSSIYTGLAISVVLLILSPTVWVDIVHKSEKEAVEKQVKGIEDGVKARIAEIEKQKVPGLDAAKLAEIDASISAEKKASEPQIKEAKSKMPQPIFPLKNPGIYSMAAAFLMGILVSLMAPDKVAESKFAGEKVREYIGVGAED